jgi:hypothetical protein
MSFHDQLQQARAVKALCAGVRRAEWWTDEGPTDEACELFEADGGPLSSGERTMLFVAFAVYAGEHHATLARCLSSLDNRNLRLVGSLMVALADERGGIAIEEWLESEQLAGLAS